MEGERRIALTGEAGERLDCFLARTTELSRTKAKALIEAGDCLVDGRQARPSQILKGGEEIEVTLPELKPLSLEPEDIPLDVVYEDEHLLVVNKPAGMVVHPAPGHPRGTLVNALLARADRLAAGTGAFRPGIVHRLDKGTSGLLLVAKSDAVHRDLSEALKARTIRRQYVAMVWGHLEPPQGEINLPVGRAPRDRKRMSVHSPQGRPARTAYRRLARYDVAEWVEVRLRTGRTHQVRVHFSAIGHPLVGDVTYGGGEKAIRGFMGDQRGKARRVLEAIDRPALHAGALSFTHPVSGEEMILTAPLPPDLVRLREIAEEGTR